MADHVQKVMKPNFAASWEEVGEENELEDTYALSMKTMDGKLCQTVKTKGHVLKLGLLIQLDSLNGPLYSAPTDFCLPNAVLPFDCFHLKFLMQLKFRKSIEKLEFIVIIWQIKV